MVKLDVGFVFGVNYLLMNDGSFKVKKNVFFGKVIVEYEIFLDKKVLFLMGNFLKLEVVGVDVVVESLFVEVFVSCIKVKEVNIVEGIVLLLEVELVVFVGRGMKGFENWGIIDEMVEIFNVIMVCLRFVVDVGWCFYYEYVG